MSSLHSVAGARAPSELTLSARGLTLRALAFGDPTQPLMIALHGWLDNAASFVPLAPMLEDYYVVALDLPGHGKSDFRASGGSYFHADYALDVAHAAAELGRETFVLLGHSMGGGVATLVAAAMPQQVSHLVLIDGLGPYSEPPENTARQLGKAIVQSLSFSSRLMRYNSLEELVQRRANVSRDIDRDALSLIVERNARQMTEGEVSWWEWSTDPRLKLASPTRLTHEAVLHVLGSISTPVLNLLASTGMMAEHMELGARTEQLANAKTVTIDGHHHFHLDGAIAEVAALTNAFTRDVAPFGRVQS